LNRRSKEKQSVEGRLKASRISTLDKLIGDVAPGRSSMEGMFNYYKANDPKEPYEEPQREFPKVKCPVLMFHGLRDPALLPGALSGTWDWVENELTLITIPAAGHFVQQDAADLVTKKMVQWLVE
jgi:pimeloyl-ACP methyl ester carboxylesterase